MLGFNERRELVKEPFASQLREQMRRAYRSEFTEKEQECEIRLQNSRTLFSFTWN